MILLNDITLFSATGQFDFTKSLTIRKEAIPIKNFDMRTFTLYGLRSSLDPHRIRYVGVTKLKLWKRISNHRYDAKKFDTKKCLWIRSVVDNGGTVSIVPLFEGIPNQEQAHEQEIAMIERLKAKGIVLENTTKGGAGTKGVPYQERIKNKIVA